MNHVGLSLSSWLLFFSVVCFSWGIFLFWLRHTPLTVSFATVPYQDPHLLSYTPPPSTLTISDLDINLPIFGGKVAGSRWPVSPSGLIHVSDSPNPGQTGNSIIYGHNWSNLLGRLKKAKVGQVISVTNSAGSTQKFAIKHVSVVSPNNIDLLSQTSRAVLTLYTCTGFLDTRRLVVTALPLQ